MKTSTITAIVLIAVGVFSVWRLNLNGPTPIPNIDAPSVANQQIVAPITSLLKGNKKQSCVLSAFYFEASKTLRRDGNGEKIIKTKSHFRTFCKRAATLRFQGIFKSIPGLADAIHGKDGALSKILGLEAEMLDHEKTADALHAIAWACQEAT